MVTDTQALVAICCDRFRGLKQPCSVYLSFCALKCDLG